MLEKRRPPVRCIQLSLNNVIQLHLPKGPSVEILDFTSFLLGSVIPASAGEHF